MRTRTRSDTKAMRTLRLCGLIGLIGLAGCSLGRGEPPQQHYVLTGGRFQENGTPPQHLAGLTIGVRRLQLASYLETPLIVVRQGPHELRFSEFHRWGEDLGAGINRVVAAKLTAGAPFGAVDVAPWPSRERYDYLVQLHVLRFEGLAPEAPAAAAGEVHLLAKWEILRQQDGAVLARGTTDYRDRDWRVGDFGGLVTSLEMGLGAVSNDVVASLGELHARKPGPVAPPS